jgi:hypothetical protein
MQKLLDTCKRYIEYIEEAIVFADLQCEVAHERYIQRIEGEKAMQIIESDDKGVITQ